MEEQDKKRSELENKVKGYKKSAEICAISLGVSILGFTFDYGAVDDIIRFGGAFSFGYNLVDTIRYAKYCFDERKSKKEKK